VLPQVNIRFRDDQTEENAFNFRQFRCRRLIEPPKAFLFYNIAPHWGVAALPDSNAANP